MNATKPRFELGKFFLNPDIEEQIAPVPFDANFLGLEIEGGRLFVHYAAEKGCSVIPRKFHIVRAGGGHPPGTSKVGAMYCAQGPWNAFAVYIDPRNAMAELAREKKEKK